MVPTLEITTEETEAEEATMIAMKALEVMDVTEFRTEVVIATRKTTDTNATTVAIASRDVKDPEALEVVDQEAETGLKKSNMPTASLAMSSLS